MNICAFLLSWINMDTDEPRGELKEFTADTDEQCTLLATGYWCGNKKEDECLDKLEFLWSR